MSKSDAQEKSRILITDTREDIIKKIKAALSDFDSRITYDPEQRPAVSNLVCCSYVIIINTDLIQLIFIGGFIQRIQWINTKSDNWGKRWSKHTKLQIEIGIYDQVNFERK